jgi:hypothetical protein
MKSGEFRSFLRKYPFVGVAGSFFKMQNGENFPQ